MNRETRTSAREAGSAYLIVLLVLVVLTILGLSLVLVTKSEMEIGANERGIQRVFYEADNGTAIATARVMASNDHSAATFDFDEPGAVLNFKSHVELAPVVPIYERPCNLCEINNAGTYNTRAFKRLGKLINSRATRVTSTDPNPLGHKLISATLDLHPLPPPGVEEYMVLTDPDALAKIKF